MAEAKVYVDIASATDLVLVGATTPVARKVELVDVTIKGDQSESRVVASMPVPGGKMTRLAYRGSHLRLVDINKDLANGTVVPVTLAFKSPDGKDVTAQFDAKVRGLLLPLQMPAVVDKDAQRRNQGGCTCCQRSRAGDRQVAAGAAGTSVRRARGPLR